MIDRFLILFGILGIILASMSKNWMALGYAIAYTLAKIRTVLDSNPQ